MTSTDESNEARGSTKRVRDRTQLWNWVRNLVSALLLIMLGVLIAISLNMSSVLKRPSIVIEYNRCHDRRQDLALASLARDPTPFPEFRGQNH